MIIIIIIIIQIIEVHTEGIKSIDRLIDNNSFLDRINKKLESLKAIERSTTVERKNDRDNRIGSFLELYEKIKETLNPIKDDL